MDLNTIEMYVKSKISEKRYNHSVGVMNMCEKLAKIYNADIEKARKVGIAHDMAKEIPTDELLKYTEKNNINLSSTEKNMPFLFHGIVAADIAKKELQFDDEMSSAIANHTISKPNMTILEKILFVSDKIEENRTYENVEFYRNLAYEDIDECIVKIIDFQIESDIKKEIIIPQKSIESRNYILINQKK